MTCDICNRLLAEDYTPQVDARGRPCLAICSVCNDQMVRERARRLGLTGDDLMSRFEAHLAEVLPPETVH